MRIRGLLARAFSLTTTSQPRADIIPPVNGDVEASPILGAGQPGVAVGALKLIQTDPPVGVQYGSSISGIPGWTYATPGTVGTQSDHGLARRDASFGRSAFGQSSFVNTWNRMTSQTVQAALSAGTTVTASVDIATLGAPDDGSRVGIFHLVAGQANPLNPDQFSARSISGMRGDRKVQRWGWIESSPVVAGLRGREKSALTGDGKLVDTTQQASHPPGRHVPKRHWPTCPLEVSCRCSWTGLQTV